MRRLALTLLVLLGLAAAASLVAEAQDKVTLKFLSVARGDPRRQAALLTIERFEKANPTVKVEFVEVPFDQYFQKLSVALASGTGVDVFDVDSPLVASYGYQDVLLPLDEYVDKRDWEDFLDQERQIATYGGKILSLPWSSSSQAVFYNLDMLKEAGITPPSSPDKRWTWAQLLDAAKKLTKKAPDGTTAVWGFVVEQVDRPYQILPLLQSNGAQALSPDGAKTAGFLNSPEAVEALQFYGDLYGKHAVSPKKPIPDAFGRGQAALFLANSPHVNVLKRLFPQTKWAVTPHPVFKKPVTPTGAWHAGVYKKTRHPREAAAFALAYSNVQQAKDNFKIMNYMPVRKSTFDAFPEEFQQLPNSLFYYEITHTAIRRPGTPAWREYEDLLRAAIRNVIDGGDAKRELDTAVARIDAVLARYKK
ncbi:MAG TPA: sugar ABC transporter substrate-binding protein [Methylomirabilota bacterium]|jgi:ABC-type glycerol-3-phosphate transport system substrate-binding protein|nr:sugar ABC transporter substrate-binding protein [Methylomirabilota bacterium]